MTVKDRIKSESTQFGKFCKTWLASILTLVGIIGGMGEWLNVLPQSLIDSVPIWVKYGILACGGVSFIYGHWTVKPKDQNDTKI